ncbi:MAG: 50S ribosomal protein L21 [Candidatus Pacebacteria bacterium]|nr:50S ribosomal protein L21 [Candidatus Paceibacterota bacterium]
MSKFAIIETGGKQYRVSEGDIITIEKLQGDFSQGDKIVFDAVLMTDDGKSAQIGTPYLDGAKVTAELLEEGRSKKVTVIRYKAKSRYFKKKGHRQPFMKVKISSL